MDQDNQRFVVQDVCPTEIVSIYRDSCSIPLTCRGSVWQNVARVLLKLAVFASFGAWYINNVVDVL